MKKQITVFDLHDILNDVSVIDVREPYEYNNGHIEGATNIPLDILANKHKDLLDKSIIYYIVCQSGCRSLTAYNYLKKSKYNVVNVIGGTSLYALQYPLV